VLPPCHGGLSATSAIAPAAPTHALRPAYMH
jgi:hypothetical protein